MQYGIDVSSNNGAIDWPTVSAYLHARCDHPFAMVKVSEGLDYRNPQWYSDRMGAHAAGFEVGLYHFARPSEASGHEEAAYLLKCIGDAGGILKGEVLALDLEDTRIAATADLHAYAVDFLQTITTALGIKPYLYSGAWYTAPHHLEGHADLAAYPLWWASYTPAQPKPPAPWDHITIWQHSARSSVPGINGSVDTNILNGSINDWRAYAWGWQPNPLDGQPVDPPPDVNVPRDSESVTDVGTIAKKISEDALALAGVLSDASLKRQAMVIKADADLLTTITWGH